MASTIGFVRDARLISEPITAVTIMTHSYFRSGAALFILSTGALIAQPYHTDTVVGGVQTLEVEGDLSLKQYGGGLGGDLNVVGDAKVAQGGQALPGLPSGVTGTYYGTLKLGSATNVGEYVFEKTGDDVTGDFVVPLGCFGAWEGTTIQIDVLTGPQDFDSGAAHFTLMSKRHRYHGDLAAITHSAIAGGKGIKIHGWNSHGMTHLFLEFDATSNYNEIHVHRAVVRVSTIGNIAPLDRGVSFSQMAPVRLANSLVSNGIMGDEMTHSFNAQDIALNGNVAVPSGKTLTVGDSAVLTEDGFGDALSTTLPPMTTAWTNAFMPRGNVSNGGLAMGMASASGLYAVARGNVTTSASGSYASATGINANATGYASVAHGASAQASGSYSYAKGPNAKAIGDYSRADGSQSKALAEHAIAEGLGVEAHLYAETALGAYNAIETPAPESPIWDMTSALLRVGNGTSPSDRSDAIKVLKNGQSTLKNKFWDENDPSEVPTNAVETSNGNALVVEGHTVLEGNAVMKGKVTIEQAQGDIGMGIYQ